jgi:UDP-N-acetylmuramate--alanine ligase
VFQPHQVSRTRALMEGFVAALALADECLIAPIYAARESQGPQTVSVAAELTSRVVGAGGRARYVADLDRIVATLDDEARPGDVVLTMGAGDIDQVHHELTRLLQRNRAS